VGEDESRGCPYRRSFAPCPGPQAAFSTSGVLGLNAAFVPDRSTSQPFVPEGSNHAAIVPCCAPRNKVLIGRYGRPNLSWPTFESVQAGARSQLTPAGGSERGGARCNEGAPRLLIEPGALAMQTNRCRVRSVARVQMLIRRPASEVFAALVDPQTMARFCIRAAARGSRREPRALGVGDVRRRRRCRGERDRAGSAAALRMGRSR